MYLRVQTAISRKKSANKITTQTMNIKGNINVKCFVVIDDSCRYITIISAFSLEARNE